MRLLDKSYIQNYINRNASSTIQNRGKSIYKGNRWQLVSFNKDKATATFKVEGTGYQEYQLSLRNIFSDKISGNCTCPYDWGPMCKHEVAVLMALEETMDENLEEAEAEALELEASKAEVVEDIEWEEPSSAGGQPGDNITRVKLGKISHLINYANTSGKMVNKAETYLKFGYIEKLVVDGTKAWVEVYDGVNWFKVSIARVNNNELEAVCSCPNRQYKLCEHKVAGLLYIRKLKGEYLFEQLKDYSVEKQSLLEAYGFSLEDKWTDKFRFNFKNGNLQLEVLDKSLKKLSKASEWKSVIRKINKHKTPDKLLRQTGEETEWQTDWELGYGIYFTKEKELPDVRIVRLIGKTNLDGNRFKSNLKDVSEVEVEMLPPMEDDSVEINHLLKKVSKHNLANYLGRSQSSSLYFYGFSDEEFFTAQNYLWNNFNKLLPLLEEKIVGELVPNRAIKTSNFTQYEVAKDKVTMVFELREADGFLALEGFLSINGEQYLLDELERKSFLFVSRDARLHLLDSIDTAILYENFLSKKGYRIHKNTFLDFYQELLLPLMEHYEVTMDVDIEIEQKTLEGSKRIYIEEAEDFLVFRPKIAYGDVEVNLHGNEKIIIQGKSQGKYIEVVRSFTLEKEFKEVIESFHHLFPDQGVQGFYALNIKEVLKDGWFFKVFENFKEQGIEVFGYDKLKRFKYNPNRPDFNLVASSGIDWFDVKMEVTFGDLKVDLKTIQQAIMRNENFIRLGDGSLGLLPEEWLKKNELLFKMSEVKKDSLQISKLHFSLVDILFEQLDDTEILKEIETKKRKLLNFDQINAYDKPEEVLADLRDYQLSGYNWMCFLDEFGWGGCLADDMGLGKTVQVLTFLQSRANLNPKQTNLIILPTSLIFNWQDEIRKFCPELSYMVHRGSDRARNTDGFAEYHLILTTYGILVRDIEMLQDYNFNYIVLDESQAIKNPNSKRYKAVRLLKAHNRLVLTGTPIENNTFDLFAQMNFLNPGLLGSMRFFKEEFSKPIDKEGDKEKVVQLKKMVYPFLLRRTKEQVATELPEKTESILFCEMTPKQRKIYDTYKINYRERIIEKMNSEGLHKARFFVLEGLLKLRQICDSPALLNNTEEVFENDSIKIETLTEHIMEKTGEHKILVFSQFVKMLGLIRTKMDEKGVVYEYLDGSTKTKDREKGVKRFQNDENCRVFLISLKAGGVGLNLTEADYVYLVDPWWNPAVEAQAIDRTHRIGQTKKVFSYKMICKESIEEKVLKLQDKKKALVTDLISAESSFFKSLGKEDIEELFR